MAEAKSKPKYKVGDYIGGDNYVLLRIMAVLTEGPEIVYGLSTPKDSDLKWSTEFELLDRNNNDVLVPDFEAYHNLKAGDILHCGQTMDREYITILARAGDLALVSMAPLRKEMGKINKLAEQIKELSDGELDMMDNLSDDAKDNMKKYSSSKYTSRVASDWHPVEWLCLMNWPIVKEG